MPSEGDGPRRRDLLRAGVGAGLLGLGGLTATDALAERGTGTGTEAETGTERARGAERAGNARRSQRTGNAFSHSLQDGDRFRVLFRPRDSAEGSTLTVPADCLDSDESRDHRLYVVRAYRGRIDLGIRGLFVPGDGDGTRTTGTTQGTTEPEETPTDQRTPEDETTADNETPTDDGTTTGNESVAGNETTSDGTTAAALQDATTTPENATTTPENATTTPENGTATPNATATPSNETVTADGAGTTATPDDGSALPEIRVGEWYEVTSSTRCDGLFRLTLASIEQPETTPG